jgi:O-acetyl-ADP-ribose deacetylase (regulator of RNase III)
MIHYTQGNLLDAEAEAIVNTVNTVGVMGKGIALMFKERYPKNMREYAQACKAKEVQTGKMFTTETGELMGPKWIVNFPTKQHWRAASKMEWITSGLEDLKRFIIENKVKSIALPPLGAGNGKLEWADVKPKIERALSDLEDVEVFIFEPTKQYQNVTQRHGRKKLTPARAMIAELIRQYWVMGMECSLLEVQKLAWFLERSIENRMASNEVLANPLDLRFEANIYGPYADRLRHVLSGLDGSYLVLEKAINDSEPLDVVWFNDTNKDVLKAYLKSSELEPYIKSLNQTAALVDGFESPFGLELLSTLDWLIAKQGIEPTLSAIKQGIKQWPAGKSSAQRKTKLFDDRSIAIALERLTSSSWAV